ncbi:MAG: hypothetical protein AAF989_09835, partial [Planctomycetota bacterium]
MLRSFRKANNRQPHKLRRRRLTTEPLERRCLLAAFIWNTNSDGIWSDPTNWQLVDGSSTTGVPKSGDTVTIDRGESNPVVTIDSDVTVDQISASENLVLAASLRVNDNLDVHAGFRWTSGDLRADQINVSNGASFEIVDSAGHLIASISNAGTIDQSTPFETRFGSVTISNTATGIWNTSVSLFSDGVRSLTFDNEGHFRKTGDGTAEFDDIHRFLHREGSRVTVDGGRLFLPTSGRQSDPSTGATFDVAAGAVLDLLNGTGYFSGTYAGLGEGRIALSRGRINVATDDALFDFPEGMFHWTGGTINTSSGQLTNSGFMSWSGNESRSLLGREFLNAGTILHQDSGETLFNSTGQGTFFENRQDAVFSVRDDGKITGGTFVNHGQLQSAGTDVAFDVKLESREGSLLRIDQGTFRLARGGVFESHTMQVSAAAMLVLDSPTNREFDLLDGAIITGVGTGQVLFQSGRIDSLQGNAAIDFSPGMFQWFGGEVLRELQNLGHVTIAPTGTARLRSDFVNRGSVLQSAGTTVTIESSVINEVGATWELTDDASFMGRNLATATFENLGTLHKTGPGTSTIQDLGVALVHHGGTVRIDEGSLHANHSGSFRGTGGHFEVANDASFLITGTWSSSGRYTGLGDGTVTVEARLVGQERDFTLDFPDGMLTWMSTSTSFSSGIVINEGFLRLEGVSDLLLRTKLYNLGTITQSSGMKLDLGNTSLTINHGNWIVESDGAFEFTQFDGLRARFRNFGVIEKRGSGTLRLTTNGSTPEWINHGTLEVTGGMFEVDSRLLNQYDSSTDTLQGGIWRVADGATLKFFENVNGEPAAPIRTNAADIRLLGAQAQFASLERLERNTGVLEIRGDRQLNLAGDFQNGDSIERVTPRAFTRAFSTRLVGLAVDPQTDTVLTHARNERNGDRLPIFRRFNEVGEGQQVGDSFVQPGGVVLNSGIDMIDSPVTLGNTQLPTGSMLFVGLGEGDDSDTPVIYALDADTGEVLASLTLAGLPRNQSGIAHHPARGSLFLMDSVGTIREISPSDGSVASEFSVTPVGAPFYSVSFGGLDVIESTGQLVIAAGSNGRLRILSPDGEFISDVDLRLVGADSGTLSDVSVNNSSGEIWISTESRSIFRLSPIIQGTAGTIRLDGDIDLNINGDFLNEGTVALSVIGRPSTGQFASISSTGDVNLGGELQIYASSSLASETGDSYRLIGGNSLQGSFDSLIAPE